MWDEKETDKNVNDERGNVQTKVDYATKETGLRDFECLTAVLLQI
jgi:hypothetical protein